MESITDVHQSLLRTHGLLHESATIILSSRMEVLYASQHAQDMLRELKGTIVRPDITVPPAILAYIGQRVMKQIHARDHASEARTDERPLLIPSDTSSLDVLEFAVFYSSKNDKVSTNL